MYRHLEHVLAQRVLECLKQRNPNAELPKIVVEAPPKVELGDFAIPIFPFAKLLRSAPLKIAQAIKDEIGTIEGIAEMQVAPPGYLNVRIDRAWMAKALANDEKPADQAPTGKILVEHSSINPNKAAHIGHLRNAILGDTFVRLLRYAERQVDIQNYIDNTGVQVADVVVGFTLNGVSLDALRTLVNDPNSVPAFPLFRIPGAVPWPGSNPIAGRPFDYLCWDVYAATSQWYQANPEQGRKIRGEVLHSIERGGNEYSGMADLISTAVLRRHLETMDRLDIEYDFLPRESEILHLHFWEAAFTKLKESGVLKFENEGKNKGCWVMRRAGTEAAASTEGEQSAIIGEDSDRVSEEDQKVIVRSNGTVGYVGKDIAYHMWKFGLLGRDFGYRKFYRYPNEHDCWISTTDGDKEHPHFGDVAEIYNVIDVRQSEAQNTVKEALRDLGHTEAADHFTHFSYGMVVLTPRCAAELGYDLTEEEKTRSFISVSGRKGFGVKADDLLDQLIASAKKEVDSRHPQLSEPERLGIATQIAIGALRYFMLKYTKQSVIAFDFEDALSFLGETGPYAQYAAVRATSIFRKAGADADSFLQDAVAKFSPEHVASYLSGPAGNEIWELWLAASKTSSIVEQCIATTEPAYLAKHVFQLAQLFNTFYHGHPILSEEDPQRKQFLLLTVSVIRRELVRCLGVLGITVPPVM